MDSIWTSHLVFSCENLPYFVIIELIFTWNTWKIHSIQYGSQILQKLNAVSPNLMYQRSWKKPYYSPNIINMCFCFVQRLYHTRSLEIKPYYHPINLQKLSRQHIILQIPFKFVVFNMVAAILLHNMHT